MELTTGMLIFGKMSTDIVMMASTPTTAMSRDITTNVYGRLNARRTIHIMSARSEATGAPRARDDHVRKWAGPAERVPKHAQACASAHTSVMAGILFH